MTDWTKVKPPISELEADIAETVATRTQEPHSTVWVAVRSVVSKIALGVGAFVLVAYAVKGLVGPQTVTRTIVKPVTIEKIVPVEKPVDKLPEGFCLLTDPKCVEDLRAQICDPPKVEVPKEAPAPKRKGR